MSSTDIAEIRAELRSLSREMTRLRTILIGERGDNGLKAAVVRLRESQEARRESKRDFALIVATVAGLCTVLGFLASHLFKTGVTP